MYRDTVGKVTVGVGLMLPDAKAAQALPFLLNNRPVTPEDIAAEYARVDALPQGRAAAFYKTQTSLELTQQTIDAKLLSVLENFEADLRTEFPHYDTFPDAIKLALLDMIYNLGPQGLFHGFPHLISAIQTGNWSLAADHCTRRGPAPARNDWTRQQFLSSVATTIKAEAESFLTQIVRIMRQIANSIFRRSVT
jgi:GH24 family phage-related lysozyme (muramidase)